MRCASFNVLADAYTTGYGDYSHVDPGLLLPGARTPGILRVIKHLDADVVGLQEVEEPVRKALDATGDWQTFWSPKEGDRPDGCLTLVRYGIQVAEFVTRAYGDQSGHIAQMLRIGRLTIANTHIKWAPPGDPDHAGVAQTAELLQWMEPEGSAVICADCNDRPGGLVRRLLKEAGFANVSGDDEPTAIVNQELVALDIVAVRGVAARRALVAYDPATIPNKECPSDHIPVVAEISPSYNYGQLQRSDE